MISGSYWNGDEWRWHMWMHGNPHPQTINIIEPPDTDAAAKRKATHPFGFARELLHRGDWPQTDPLLWEGDQA